MTYEMQHVLAVEGKNLQVLIINKKRRVKRDGKTRCARWARNRSSFSFFFFLVKNTRERNRAELKKRWISYVHKARRCTYVHRCLCEIDGAWDERVPSRYRKKNPRISFARKFGEPAGVLATNYARVEYTLFTHREYECAQYKRAGFAFRNMWSLPETKETFYYQNCSIGGIHVM